MFLEMMVEHHEGAIEMAKTEKADGKYGPATKLADDIITAGRRDRADERDAQRRTIVGNHGRDQATAAPEADPRRARSVRCRPHPSDGCPRLVTLPHAVRRHIGGCCSAWRRQRWWRTAT